MSSLKQELETWATALERYDAEDYEGALDFFGRIGDTSRICTNIGLIHATIGDHDTAIQYFTEATSLDKHLAVAFFQCGVSHFLLGNFEAALDSFAETILHLRGNSFIDYDQLGLKFQLYAAEVYFNQGLCHIYAGRLPDGMADMQEALNWKTTPEHDVIQDAIAAQGEDFTVFSIPVGVMYRPSSIKLKNAKTKDYMGKAKLAPGSDAQATNTTFEGEVRPRELMRQDSTALSRSATAPPPSASRSANNAPPRAASGLSRAQTTLNVPSDARERIAGLSAGGPPAPARGLSVTNKTGPAPARRTSDGDSRAPAAAAQAPPPPSKGKAQSPPQGKNPSRLTEFYDDFLDSYGGDEGNAPPPLPMPSNQQKNLSDRVRAANAADGYGSPAPSRMTSLRNGGGSGGSVSSGSMRRRPTRRNTTRRAVPSYYEEEEGYVSGEYEDGPFELSKIRVKLHYEDDIRGMALTPEMPFDEFMERLTTKFNKGFKGLTLKFKDEDGTKVSLRDESDYELAIETARESADGKPEGKLEIWVMDA